MVSPMQVVSNSEAVSSKTNINQHCPMFCLPWSLNLEAILSRVCDNAVKQFRDLIKVKTNLAKP